MYGYFHGTASIRIKIGVYRSSKRNTKKCFETRIAHVKWQVNPKISAGYDLLLPQLCFMTIWKRCEFIQVRAFQNLIQSANSYEIRPFPNCTKFTRDTRNGLKKRNVRLFSWYGVNQNQKWGLYEFQEECDGMLRNSKFVQAKWHLNPRISA